MIMERKNEKLKGFIFDIPFLLFLGSIILVLNQPMWSGNVPGWSDNYGHAEKIWFTSNYLKTYGWLPRWDSYWACGYPIYQFYSPLSYLIASLLVYIVGGVEKAYASTLQFASFLGGALTYYYVKKVFHDRFAAIVAGLFFSLCSHFYWYFIWIGTFPYGIAAMIFIPASFIIFEKMWSSEIRQPKQITLLAIDLALALFTHVNSFVVLFYILTLFTLCKIFLTQKSNRVTMMFSMYIKLFIAFALAFSLTAIWTLPFYVMKDKMIPWNYLGMWWEQVNPQQFLDEVGTIPFWSALPSLMFLKSRREHRPFVPILLVCMAWSFGQYSPLTWPFFSSLPMSDTVTPKRTFIMVIFILSILTAAFVAFLSELIRKRIYKETESTKTKFKKRLFYYLIVSLLATGLIVPFISDASMWALAGRSGNAPSADYIEICRLLSENNTFSRVGGHVYSPAWHDLPITGTGYFQGSQIPWFVYNYKIYMPEEQWEGYYQDIAQLFDEGYVISETSHEMESSSYYESVLNYGRYSVYQRVPFPEYCKPFDPGLILVFSEYASVVKSLYEIVPRSTNVLTDSPQGIDNFDPSSTGDYDCILMFGYSRTTSNIENLQTFIRQGKTIIIDTCGSTDEQGDFLGVQSNVRQSFGPVNWSFSDSGSFLLYDVNVSRFSGAEWENQPWQYTMYDGLDEVYAYVDSQPVLGVKNMGSGKIFFVGFNLFLHMSYYYNYDEAKLIANILNLCSKNSITPLAGAGYARLIEREPEKIVIEYETSSPYILVSEAYYPAWVADIDGSEIAVQNYFNLMTVKVTPGKHVLTLEMALQWYDYAGLTISCATIIVLIALNYYMKKEGRRTRISKEERRARPSKDVYYGTHKGE